MFAAKRLHGSECAIVWYTASAFAIATLVIASIAAGRIEAAISLARTHARRAGAVFDFGYQTRQVTELEHVDTPMIVAMLHEMLYGPTGDGKAGHQRNVYTFARHPSFRFDAQGHGLRFERAETFGIAGVSGSTITTETYVLTGFDGETEYVPGSAFCIYSAVSGDGPNGPWHGYPVAMEPLSSAWATMNTYFKQNTQDSALIVNNALSVTGFQDGDTLSNELLNFLGTRLYAGIAIVDHFDSPSSAQAFWELSAGLIYEATPTTGAHDSFCSTATIVNLGVSFNGIRPVTVPLLVPAPDPLPAGVLPPPPVKPAVVPQPKPDCDASVDCRPPLVPEPGEVIFSDIVSVHIPCCDKTTKAYLDRVAENDLRRSEAPSSTTRIW